LDVRARRQDVERALNVLRDLFRADLLIERRKEVGGEKQDVIGFVHRAANVFHIVDAPFMERIFLRLRRDVFLAG